MEVVVIKSTNPENVRLLTELARKLGDDVNLISLEEAEDFALGRLMELKKVGEAVSRDAILKKLQG